MVRAASGKDTASNAATHKDYRTPWFAGCVADRCAMWRWATNGNYEHDCAVTGTDLGQPVTPAGFCGLAGAPAAHSFIG